MADATEPKTAAASGETVETSVKENQREAAKDAEHNAAHELADEDEDDEEDEDFVSSPSLPFPTSRHTFTLKTLKY